MADNNDRSLEQKDESRENVFNELYNRVRLIVRLLKDDRVNFFLKLIPIGVLIYLVVPLDFLPVNPIDDAVVILLGSSLFIELCPEDVVQEHRQALSRNAPVDENSTTSESDVLDGEFRDVPPQDRQ